LSWSGHYRNRNGTRLLGRIAGQIYPTPFGRLHRQWMQFSGESVMIGGLLLLFFFVFSSNMGCAKPTI
jgi:hypothetical protein